MRRTIFSSAVRMLARPTNPPKPAEGQESVWDYPRPAVMEEEKKPLKVVCNGQIIAETSRGKRVLETSHPPTYYFPPEDVRMEYLEPTGRRTFCEWKGATNYFNVVVGDKKIPNGAWQFCDPTKHFQGMQNHIAFYARDMDACFVGDEKIIPQAGPFYGGWITSNLVGPFKGDPGTEWW